MSCQLGSASASDHDKNQMEDGLWRACQVPALVGARMVVGTARPISLATSNRGGCRGLSKLTTMPRSSRKSKTMRAVAT
jgi:hypothetical protein